MYALTAKGSRYLDEYTMKNGIPSAVLMENASRGVVDYVMKQFPDTDTSVLVLAGPGNNGGDGICVARWLLHLGYDVSVYFVGNPGSASKEFARQVQIITNMFPDAVLAGFGESGDIKVLDREYDCIIDGLFGTGLNKRLGYNYIKFLEYINAKSGYKIAIDIPSGLNATTGQIMDAVFIADATVTFGSYKTGMFFEDGSGICGDIILVDIGLDNRGYDDIDDKIFICDADFYEKTRREALVSRKRKSYKGTYGTVGIVVGLNSMNGAAMLSARAAYRSGCGLVKILCPKKYVGFFNISIPEAVIVPYGKNSIEEKVKEFAEGVGTVVIGPGLSEDPANRELVLAVLSTDCKAVFDAGATYFISKNLKSFRDRQCECVLTPHIGEMAKLCHEDKELIEKNRIGFTKKFSEKFGVSMVVKTDSSLISLIEGEKQELYLNVLGNAGLATAGTGDVLSGIIASLIAQGNSVNAALLYGVMAHARTAEKFADDEDSQRRLMAGDVAEYVFK